ncbi:MAG: alpha/beta hydrolase [Candidatus Izemoplasmatales bacterium]
MWFLLAVVLLFLIFLFVALQIAFTIVLPKKRSLELTKEMELAKDSLIFNFYDEHLTKEGFVESRYGYNIKLYYFLNSKSKQYVIMSHGHTHSHHGMLKYAQMMKDYGFNVIIYDQRYHGNSGGKNTTLGFYEKFDLYDLITHVFKEFGEDIFLGTYGESMGAATVLLESSFDERVKFVISDCGFSSLDFLIKEQLRSKKVPKIFYPFINMFVKIITGIKMEEVSPIKAIKNINKPILFIHGKQDLFIGYEHSVNMYDSYSGPKKIYLAEGNATHANSFYAKDLKYKEIVKDFLEENLNVKV